MTDYQLNINARNEDKKFRERIVRLKTMQASCPKCGKKIAGLNYFGDPDESMVSGYMIHSFKSVCSVFGSATVPDEKCFVTKEEIETTLKSVGI